jgi:hypothetical protein
MPVRPVAALILNLSKEQCSGLGIGRFTLGNYSKWHTENEAVWAPQSFWELARIINILHLPGIERCPAGITVVIKNTLFQPTNCPQCRG